MTEKENVLKVLNGEIPEWVPRYMTPPVQGSPYRPAFAMAMPSALRRVVRGDEEYDIGGVPYSATENTGGMALPTPGKFILDDITRWRDVIKAPDISGIDCPDGQYLNTYGACRRPYAHAQTLDGHIECACDICGAAVKPIIVGEKAPYIRDEDRLLGDADCDKNITI